MTSLELTQMHSSSSFFFNSWVMSHCVYIPHLSYLFVCWWTSKLLPCPSCCKQCFGDHWSTCVSFNSGFLGVYAQQWDCWVISSVQFSSVTQSCPTLCDPMNHSTPGLLVHCRSPAPAARDSTWRCGWCQWETEAASHFSWTACLFQAYDSLLYFYKSIRSEVWYF